VLEQGRRRRSLGSQRKELSPAHIDDITRIFGEYPEVMTCRRCGGLDFSPR